MARAQGMACPSIDQWNLPLVASKPDPAAGVALFDIDIRRDAFEVPEPLHAVAAATGVDPMTFILTGGDDHPLVGTFPPGVTLPEGWSIIGQVSEGEGATVDGSPYEGPAGHTHF